MKPRMRSLGSSAALTRSARGRAARGRGQQAGQRGLQGRDGLVVRRRGRPSITEVSSLEEARPGRSVPVTDLSVRIVSLGLGEEVGAVAACRAQVVGRAVQAVVGQQRLGPVVAEGGPLQLEAQQLGVDRRAALLDALHQRAVGWVGDVGGEAQRRVGAGPADHLGGCRPARCTAGGGVRGRRARRPCRRVGRRRRWRGGRPRRAVGQRRPRPRRRRAARGPRGRSRVRSWSCPHDSAPTCGRYVGSGIDFQGEEAYLRWPGAGPGPRKSECARCEAAPPAVHRRLSGAREQAGPRTRTGPASPSLP